MIKKTVIIKITITIIIFIIITSIIIINKNNDNAEETKKLNEIEQKINQQFNHWQNNSYKDMICADKSKKIEEYVETQLNLTCYLAYSKEHVWDIIIIDNKSYEFESTSLCFSPVSLKYIILDIRNGFYIHGIKVSHCYEL